MEDMKKAIKLALRTIIKRFTREFSATRVGRLFNEVVIDDVMNRVYDVIHDDLKLKFAVPNAVNRFRVESFSTKEP